MGCGLQPCSYEEEPEEKQAPWEQGRPWEVGGESVCGVQGRVCQTGLGSWRRRLLAVWPWVSHTAPLSRSFPLPFKNGIDTLQLSKVSHGFAATIPLCCRCSLWAYCVLRGVA